MICVCGYALCYFVTKGITRTTVGVWQPAKGWDQYGLWVQLTSSNDATIIPVWYTPVHMFMGLSSLHMSRNGMIVAALEGLTHYECVIKNERIIMLSVTKILV